MLKISNRRLFSRVKQAKKVERLIQGSAVLNEDAFRDLDFIISNCVDDFINGVLKVKDYGEYFGESDNFDIRKLADNAFDIVYYEYGSYKDTKKELLKLKKIKENA